MVASELQQWIFQAGDFRVFGDNFFSESIPLGTEVEKFLELGWDDNRHTFSKHVVFNAAAAPTRPVSLHNSHRGSHHHLYLLTACE